MHRRPVTLWALVAALVLLVTACEVDEGDPAAEEPLPATPEADEPAQTPGAAEEGALEDGVAPDDEPPAEQDVLTGDPEATVVDVLEDSGQFEQLLAAIDEAGLTEQLRGEGPFTVFAPTDAAFERLPAALVERLSADPEQFERTLLSHVAGEEIALDDLTTDEQVQLLDGSARSILVTDDDVVLFGPAAVVDGDAEASNGVVHAIDVVLSPVEAPEG